MAGLSRQALNSINLYKGNPSSQIIALLNMQSASVVNELKAHFNVSSTQDLASKLSSYK